jgi:hypothetical protein
MGEPSRAAPAEPLAPLDLLLARAAAIANGADHWADPELRRAFAARSRSSASISRLTSRDIPAPP